MDTFKKELVSSYGFEEMGNGSFGTIFGNASTNCAVKVIQDLGRCAELSNEKEIYEMLSREENTPLFEAIFAKVPRFRGYFSYASFCHFNFQRLMSPLSGFGDIEDDDNYGHGYVVAQTGPLLDERLKMYDATGERSIVLKKEDVYPIDRPGSLIHFYINHYDTDLKEKLDNGQGYLFGIKQLKRIFGKDTVSMYANELGKLLGLLVCRFLIVPTDIEVVLATEGKNDRVVRPYVLDFNECRILPENSLMSKDAMAMLMTNSLKAKNGKHYIPDSRNEFYAPFWSGFVETGGSLGEKIKNVF